MESKLLLLRFIGLALVWFLHIPASHAVECPPEICEKAFSSGGVYGVATESTYQYSEAAVLADFLQQANTGDDVYAALGCYPVYHAITKSLIGTNCDIAKNGELYPYSLLIQVSSCVGRILDGDCITEPIDPEKNSGEPCECVGNPINPGFGNKFQREHDYRGQRGLMFTRSYDSTRHKDRSFFDTTLGTKWRHQFDKRILYDPRLSTGQAYYISSDGKKFRFVKIGGAWKPDADFNGKLQPALNANNEVIGWTLAYGPDDTDVFDASGKLASTGRRSGYRQNLTYSDVNTPQAVASMSGLLINVTDTFGRSLNFTYDSAGRIATMTDAAGGTYRYAYDAKNNLASVTTPDMAVRHYLYENANFPDALTGITDENGSRFASWSYDGLGRAISSEHAGGAERVTLDYTTSGITTVTDSLNTARTYTFQSFQGVLKPVNHSQPGGAMEMTYDANGNVASRIDRNGSKACYAYDLARNLETVRVEGLSPGADCAASLAATSLTEPARKITTQWSNDFRLPEKVAEPKRITSLTYDAQGNLLSRKVQGTLDQDGSKGFNAVPSGSARTWSYTYNSAGQRLTTTGPRTDVAEVTVYAYDTQGNLTSIRNPAGHTTTLENYDAHGHPGRIVDPNGLVTELTYNPRGWLTAKRVGDVLTSYEYDAMGQLKKVTLPDSGWVSYTYDDAHRVTAISDSLGNRIDYILDPMGNRINERVNDPNGTLARQTTRVYDPLNRLQQITGGLQ